MPNGRLGDHPITDMLIHGEHPFPPDVEEMLRRLHALDPALLSGFEMEPLEWAQGRKLDSARRQLWVLLAKHVGPAASASRSEPDA